MDALFSLRRHDSRFWGEIGGLIALSPQVPPAAELPTQRVDDSIEHTMPVHLSPAAALGDKHWPSPVSPSPRANQDDANGRSAVCGHMGRALEFCRRYSSGTVPSPSKQFVALAAKQSEGSSTQPTIYQDRAGPRSQRCLNRRPERIEESTRVVLPSHTDKKRAVGIYGGGGQTASSTAGNRLMPTRPCD